MTRRIVPAMASHTISSCEECPFESWTEIEKSYCSQLRRGIDTISNVFDPECPLNPETTN
jgi:hypothetical protein